MNTYLRIAYPVGAVVLAVGWLLMALLQIGR
jgi:hypothetical protein